MKKATVTLLDGFGKPEERRKKDTFMMAVEAFEDGIKDKKDTKPSASPSASQS